MRAVVFGGRDFGNLGNKKKSVEENLAEYQWVMKCLTDYAKTVKSPLHIITGMATGVDLVAYEFALNNKLTWSEYPANWNRYGRGAGFKRNTQMIIEGKPDIGLAFPGGPGTRNMKQQLRSYRIKFLEFRYNVENEVYQL